MINKITFFSIDYSIVALVSIRVDEEIGWSMRCSFGFIIYLLRLNSRLKDLPMGGSSVKQILYLCCFCIRRKRRIFIILSDLYVRLFINYKVHNYLFARVSAKVWKELVFIINALYSICFLTHRYGFSRLYFLNFTRLLVFSPRS